MMAGGAVQHNGIFTNPHHNSQPPHMESDSLDSRKRPLETPTEASSTKRTNTGGKTVHNVWLRGGPIMQKYCACAAVAGLAMGLVWQ